MRQSDNHIFLLDDYPPTPYLLLHAAWLPVTCVLVCLFACCLHDGSLVCSFAFLLAACLMGRLCARLPFFLAACLMGRLCARLLFCLATWLACAWTMDWLFWRWLIGWRVTLTLYLSLRVEKMISWEWSFILAVLFGLSQSKRASITFVGLWRLLCALMIAWLGLA